MTDRKRELNPNPEKKRPSRTASFLQVSTRVHFLAEEASGQFEKFRQVRLVKPILFRRAKLESLDDIFEHGPEPDYNAFNWNTEVELVQDDFNQFFGLSGLSSSAGAATLANPGPGRSVVLTIPDHLKELHLDFH